MAHRHMRAVEEIERLSPAERIARRQAASFAAWRMYHPTDTVPFMVDGILAPGSPEWCDLRVIANPDPTPDRSPEDCVEPCHVARTRAQWRT